MGLPRRYGCLCFFAQMAHTCFWPLFCSFTERLDLEYSDLFWDRSVAVISRLRFEALRDHYSTRSQTIPLGLAYGIRSRGILTTEQLRNEHRDVL